MASRQRTQTPGFRAQADRASPDPVPTQGVESRPPSVESRPPSAETLLARVRLGELIRNRREELRLKPKEVAARLGWTTQFYGELEKGLKSSPDVRSWVRLADTLQLDG